MTMMTVAMRNPDLEKLHDIIVPAVQETTLGGTGAVLRVTWSAQRPIPSQITVI
jgi:hypothetical protein